MVGYSVLVTKKQTKEPTKGVVTKKKKGKEKYEYKLVVIKKFDLLS